MSLHDNLIGVKMDRSYHHGDLRQAIIDTSLAVLAEKGVEGFSLRDTARRVGVSAAAYKHHFPSTRALMTTLAEISFARLADALEHADANSGRNKHERLVAQGTAYVGFAFANSAMFDLMWRSALLDLSDPKLSLQKARAFNCLDRLVRGATAQSRPFSDPEMASTIACWSLVHGFARLVLDGGLEAGDAHVTADSGTLSAMLSMLGIGN